MNMFIELDRPIRTWTALALALAAGAGVTPARASDGEATELLALDEGGISEIMVTARKRDESLQEVPIAISVLGGAALEQKGAYHLQQIYQEVPSLTVFTVNPRNVNINIRGLGSNVAIANNGLDLGVGFYVDDVYYARVGQAGFDLVDVDHVEVLRGPQGTLFGRNTTAGAISVATKSPSFTTEAAGDIAMGNYGLIQGRGTVSGPIIDDRLAGRLSIESTTRNGFVKNVYQDRRVHDFDNATVRGSLLWHASDAIDVKLSADYARQKQNCCVAMFLGVVTSYDNGAPVTNTLFERNARLGYTPLPFDPGARTTDADWLGPIRMKQGGVSARVDWDLGAATLTSISAWRFWDWTPHNDTDYSALNIYTGNNQFDRQRQWSQEIRLASTGKRRLDYVLGLYAFHQSIRGWFVNSFGRDAGEWLIAPDTSGLTPEQRRAALDGAYTYAPSKPQTDSYAAFGQATWHATDAISVTGGLRFTHERKHGYFEQTRGGGSDISTLNAAQLAQRYAFTPVVPRYSLSRSWNSLSGLLTVSGQLTSDALAYATYSRGAKSGGINLASLPLDANGAVRSDLAVIKPEKVDNFEVGLKTQWLDRRLTANIALFLVNVRNYQSTVYDQSIVPAKAYISNVGKVRSKGVEIDLRATPGHGLTLYAGGTYNAAKYVRYENAQCPFELRAPGQPALCDLSGAQLPGAPRWSASAGGEYAHPVGNAEAYVAADYSYRSSYYSSYNDSRYSKINGFSLVNARLGIRSDNKNWDVSVWSRNIFNKLYYYYTSVNDIGAAYTGSLGDPRTFGVTLRSRF